MKIKSYKSIFETSEEPLWEMSNFFPNDTGLEHVIWISTKTGREKHGPRIKVFGKDGEIHISISDEPEIKKQLGKINIKKRALNKIFDFIKLNKDVLLSHWNGKISSKGLSDKIKSIN